MKPLETSLVWNIAVHSVLKDLRKSNKMSSIYPTLLATSSRKPQFAIFNFYFIADYMQIFILMEVFNT